MTNKVGDKLLTTQKAHHLLKQLKDIVEELRPYGVMLTTEERQRALRPRRGAEPHMQRVHDLAVKHGISLKNISLEGMPTRFGSPLRAFRVPWARGSTARDP